MSLSFAVIVQIAGLVALIALAARITIARTPEVRRRRVVELTVYIVVTHLAVGITQRDAWPITTNRLMHGLAPPASDISLFTFYGVDDDGREWRIDPYAWRSISEWHLHFWFFINFREKLTPDQQHEALAWLLGLAEKRRAQLAAGNSAISPLGPVSAPQFWMLERQPNVPSTPYRALRVYLETFTIAGAMAEAQEPYRIVKQHVDRVFVGEWKPR